jgi:tetratricopeptide (TPR) repeat protein
LSLTAAARLLDEPEPTTDRLLERLVDAQLLETPSPGRYQFHDLMRLYAHQQATRQYPASVRMAALTSLFGFLTATAWQSLRLLRPGDRRLATADPRWAQGGLRFVDAAAALSWLEAERVNLMAAIGQAAAAAPAIPAGVVYQLTRALFGFFDVRSYWHDELRADETALSLARAAGDRAAQAQACIDLGSLHYQTGRYQEGIALLREGLVLARELGDRFGEAASLSNLGSIHERLGNYQEAIAWQQDSLTIRRELGDRFGEAASLNNFGVVHERLGNYREAIACHQDSITICRELGDRHGQAEAFRDLGDALLGAGRPQQAREAWQEALELCEALQLPQAEDLRALLNDLRPQV